MNHIERSGIHPVITDALRAVLVGAIAWVTAEVSVEPAIASPGSASLVLAVSLAVLQFWQRRFPLGVLLTCVLSLAVYNGLGFAAVAPVWPLLIPLGFAASVGSLGHAALVAAIVTLASGFWRAVIEQEATVSVLVGEVQSAIVIGLALAVGEAIWQRRRWASEVARRLQQEREASKREAEQRMTEERMAAAADLHDISGHSMVLIGLHLQRAREWLKTDTGAAHSAIDSALDAHTQAMRETTETVRHLREGLGGQVPMLADGYLDLDWLKDRVAAAGMSLDIDMEPVGSLSINAALALHRLLQEALTNTLRHAAATRISISIGPDGDSVRLRFGDDGRGSSIEEHTAGSRTGLRGMRARIERLGGRLDVHSTPYDGFVINAWLPRETGP